MVHFDVLGTDMFKVGSWIVKIGYADVFFLL